MKNLPRQAEEAYKIFSKSIAFTNPQALDKTADVAIDLVPIEDVNKISAVLAKLSSSVAKRDLEILAKKLAASAAIAK